MISAGFETTDPFTQTRFVVIEGARETNGRGWVLEVHCPEGAGPAFLPHVHRTWTETFDVIQGTASYRLGNTETKLAAGERVVMPPNVVHLHPWNTGSGTMIYRQTNDFGAATPDAVYDVLGAFATIHGLAREGRVSKHGLPKNPFQFAATGRAFTKHQSYDAAMPVALQVGLSATFGRLAEALGYRAVYDRYLR
jgi:mannose-6-phosphate isomerase-like protein (cupin superfamily)